MTILDSRTALASDAAVLECGAYTDDVLRIVRGTPNPDELAALVAALLFTRRVRETRGTGTSANSYQEHQGEPRGH
jgi:hypothetical protein